MQIQRSTIMPTRKKATPKDYINNDLPILYVDDVNTRHRDDGMNYLSFTTNIPDRFVEQVRLMIDDEHLHQLIDYLCKATDYFPERTRKGGKGLQNNKAEFFCKHFANGLFGIIP